ncbi:MAG: DUF192 domain-containing protein [Myxococcaceae bacterium]
MGLLRRALAIGALASFAGCPASGGGGKAVSDAPRRASNDPAAEDYPAPVLPTAKVVLLDAFGGKHLVEVEVAATPPTRQRGLMWRKELAEGRGMLFIFPGEEEISFWMKNTLIPLDMIFIATDRTVVGVVQRAEPRTLSSRQVEGQSQYVLEVPGGWCEKIGLKVGSKVELQGVSMIAVQP